MDYTPIISALFGPLLLFAVFAALVALLRLSFFGAIGEAAVSCRLRRHFAEVADGKRGLEKGARSGKRGQARMALNLSSRDLEFIALRAVFRWFSALFFRMPMQAYVFASSGPWPLVLSSMGIASGAPGIESGGAFSGTNHDFACSMCLEELF